MKKIVFMGTPQFSVPILEALVNNENVQIEAVVTQPDRKVGRKKVLTAPPVKEAALKHDLKVLQPEKISGSKEMQSIIDMNPDLIVTAAYGQFLPEALLEAPTYKSINVHASLLPKYRGAAPIHYAIWNGDQKTGISIIYMTKAMDAGDVLARREIDIDRSDDTGKIFNKLSIVGRDLLMDTLPNLFNETISPEPQDDSLATYSPMISKEQEQLDWEEEAEALFNKIRAFRPFPGTYTLLDDKRFKVWDSEVANQTTEKAPGTIVKVTNEKLYVACGKGTVLSLLVVQPAGKQKMTVDSYLLGANLEVGDSFGE